MEDLESSEDLVVRVKHFLSQNRIVALLFLIGVILLGSAFVLYGLNIKKAATIEIVDLSTDDNGSSSIVVEIAGAIKQPGVYKLTTDARIQDLIDTSGGFTDQVDYVWVENYLNRAAMLSDGQKVFIPKNNWQTDVLSDENSDTITPYQGSGGTSPHVLINVNTASFQELDSLPGIGQVYGQNIIEQRPYSSKEELLSKEILPKATFDKIKDLITVY